MNDDVVLVIASKLERLAKAAEKIAEELKAMRQLAERGERRASRRG